MVIEEDVASAMPGRLPACSPAQHVGRGRPAEVADVDALGAPHPARAARAAGGRARTARPRGRSRCDRVRAAPRRRLRAARDHVVGQLGHGGRDVAAQHVDRRRAARRPRVVLLGRRTCGVPRAAAARRVPGGSGAPPTNPKRRPPIVDDPAVGQAHAGPGELGPQRRHVDVARDGVRRRRHRGEQRPCTARGPPPRRRRAGSAKRAHAVPDEGAQLAGPPAGAAAGRTRRADLGPEHPAEDARGRGRGSRRSRRRSPSTTSASAPSPALASASVVAVHVGDHVHPHDR